MEPANKLEIFSTPAQLAEGTAAFIIDMAKKAVNKKDRFVISLSGGHTPERLYALLATPAFREQLPWNKTFVFWGDERCVPEDDEQNNAHMAKIVLLDHVRIPAENIHTVPVALPPEDAARAYDQTIKNFFAGEPAQFDMVLLGLGDNGHTASLFPGNDNVFDKNCFAKEVYVPEQKMFRVTMTPQLINDANNILFLVEGNAKAAMVNTILNAPYQPAVYPAQLIKPVRGNIYWFLDAAAAALLPNKDTNPADKPS